MTLMSMKIFVLQPKSIASRDLKVSSKIAYLVIKPGLYTGIVSKPWCLGHTGFDTAYYFQYRHTVCAS